MQADFSRWTFDGKAGFRSVLLQQGRVVLDADWNEQTQIAAYHDEVRTGDVVGPSGAPAGDAAFGLVDGTGAAPASTPWGNLRLTPGRFYVDGVLTTVDDPGAPLASQPYLPAGPALPGLTEPGDDGRYAVVLEVFSHHVTADETPRLRESALGGPDTTTREQTVWQVRLAPVDDDQACAGAHPWLDHTPPTMTASLADVPPGSDPCRITSAEGYRRLENQLYRVQIHDVSGARPTYLWSRENASVVAGLVAIGSTTASGMDHELTLDRIGRDEELSIGEGDLIEVTSVDRQLHGLPGFLATAGPPEELHLPVAWLDAEPTTVADLGRVPLVRRWEGGPANASATRTDLEDGIQVRFGDGDFRVGDHWLIPARTVRLVYGATALAGTIEWPVAGGAPQPQPPLGPIRHRTTLALVDRTTAGGAGRWTLVSDCRRLFPPLTQLIAIDLLGGDGQESLPGVALPHPIRVAVRNGGLPVEGATVQFATTGDHLSTGTPTAADPATLPLDTDENGEVEVRWLLGGSAPSTRVMTARLLDDAGTAIGAEVQVTGHVSLATETAYDPASCEEMAEAGVDTVQEALDHLCQRRNTWPGLHVLDVIAFVGNRSIGNDTRVPAGQLVEGFGVILDDAAREEWVNGKPVLELAVELPWPNDAAQREIWGDQLVGTQQVVLRGEVTLREPPRSNEPRMVTWQPDGGVNAFLRRLPEVAATLEVDRVLARITLRGNVIGAARDERFVNGLAFGELRRDGTTALQLPTVDDVHGADFTMWFWIPAELASPPRIAVNPTSIVFGPSPQTVSVTITNTGGSTLRVETEIRGGLDPAGAQNFSVAPATAEVAPGGTGSLAVSSARGIFAGIRGDLVVKSNDPSNPSVVVSLLSVAIGLVPTRTGVLRLKAPREEIVDPQAGARRLESELVKREGDDALRVAVAPGFEASFEVLRERLAADGIDVVVVEGDPAEAVARAAAGELVLDAVVGDAQVAASFERGVLPVIGLPEEG